MTHSHESDGQEVRAGLVLGRYELLVPIAAGGMAQVWAARLKGARQFQKLVAVKTMLPKLSEDEQFEQMFLDEASLASQIRHPNAVEISDLGEQNGVLYLVMEWIEGVPLNQLMKVSKATGGVPYHIAARIVLSACAGLHAAHELRDEKGQLVGLVHRDVSPQNLLVTYDGVTKVVDFGVAKATALGGGATVAGQIKGKVSYMAPEQVNGEGLDRRADVFAIGIVLYALTTGKHPFRRESEAATMYNICSPQPVLPPSKVQPDYPKALEAVVMKALAKNRDERYSTADEMLKALDSLPAELRASSDSDVATFVTGILGSKRIEQRKRIDDAMSRADTAQENGLWPGHDVQSQVTGRMSLGSMTSTQELSGVPTGVHPSTTRNRILGAFGLVALLLSGAALWIVVMDRRPQAPQEIRVIEAPEPPPAAAQAPVEPAEDLGDLEEGTSLDTLEEEKAAEKASAKTPPAPAAPSAAAPKNTGAQNAPPSPPATKPKPAPAPAGNWKYDAGF